MLSTSQWAMVVAVVTVRVVDVPTDQVVDVIPVRHASMTAGRGVLVHAIVLRARMAARAVCWVCAVDRESMLVYMVAVRAMQMTLVQVVDVAVVLHCRVFATAVDVGVSRVGFVCSHRVVSFSCGSAGAARRFRATPRSVLLPR